LESAHKSLQIGIAPVSVTRKLRAKPKIRLDDVPTLTPGPAVRINIKTVVFEDTHIDLKARNVYFNLWGKILNIPF